MIKPLTRLILLLTLLGPGSLLLPQQAVAADPENRWEAESTSYRAHLGVVPATLIKRNPVLVDGDKRLHGGAGKQRASAQHLMVALYKKADNSRITNATVIAEVEQEKLLGSEEQEKPLEKMATTGGITYGNYFQMPDSGPYEIELKIYTPERNGKEVLSLRYVRP